MSIEYLRNIEHNLNQVLNIATTLDNCDKETLNQIISTYRKIRLSRLLDNENFVAIGGTQGAGKTTLLSTIYKDYNVEDWLKSNSGRGEQIPVFVYEKQGITEPSAEKIIYNTITKTESSQSCEKDEFQNIITQWKHQGKEDEQVLYVRLFVPPVFNIPFGWVLLPGYEVETRENSAWQHLMRYVMTHSLGVILVTSEERLAHSQQNIIDDLTEGLQGRQPVIAVTRADIYRNDKEKIKDLTERAKEVFKVTGDKVVFTGIDFENWKNDFEQAVAPILQQDKTVIEHKLHALLDVIDDEVGDIINSMEDLALNAETSDEQVNRQIEKMIDKFDKSANKYKRELSKKLAEQTSSSVIHAIKEAQKNYEEEEVGLKNNLKIGFKHITFNGSKVEDRRKERVQEQLGSKRLMESNLEAINKTAEIQLNLKLGSNTNQLLGYEETETEDGIVVTKHDNHEKSILDTDYNNSVQQGLMALLRKSDMSESSNKNIENALEVLPSIAMEYSRLVQSSYLNSDDEELHRKVEEKTFNPDDVANLMKGMLSNAQNSSAEMKTVLGVVGSLTGMDLLDGKLDGQVNLSSNDSSVEGATSNAIAQSTTLLATRVAGTALAVATVAFTAYQASNSIALADKSNKEYIEMYANELGRNNNALVLAEYDDNMQKLSEYLRANLEQMYGIGSTDSQHRLMVALKYLKNARKEVRKVLKNEELNMV